MKEDNFYFSHDDSEFKATDLFDFIKIVETDEAGALIEGSEIDIIEDVTFNAESPAELYEYSLTTDQSQVFYTGSIEAFYQGVPIPDATPVVYIGTKGDVSLNGTVDVDDAVASVQYYAKASAMLEPCYSDDEVMNRFIYFLADIDTESKLGENTLEAEISMNDVISILKHYAQTSAGLNPKWD